MRYLNTYPTVENPVAAAAPAVPAAPVTAPVVTAAVAIAAVATAPTTTAPVIATAATLVDAFCGNSVNSGCAWIAVELVVSLTAIEFATRKKRNSGGLAFY